MAHPPTQRSEACWRLLGWTAEQETRDVFAVLDGARVRLLPGHVDALGAEYACLYSGETDPVEVTRAPYLVRVPEGSAVADWLLAEGWGQSWGLFVLCPRDTELDPVLRDLRELLQARLPDGRIVRFRFYDPRVWRSFFLTCDARQLQQLFGRKVTAFACEDADGQALLLETVERGQPQRRRHLLPP